MDLTKFGAEYIDEPPAPAPADFSFVKRFAKDAIEEDESHPYRPDLVEKVQREEEEENMALGQLMSKDYDPEDTFGDGWVENLNVIDIKKSASLVDKERKFKEHFPGSHLRIETINDKQVLLAKKNPNEPWRKIDSAPINLAASAGTLGTTLGIGGEIAGNVAGAALLPAMPTVGGALGGALGGGAGYLLGTVADKAIEKGRGY
jgi:hypothetical protein